MYIPSPWTKNTICMQPPIYHHTQSCVWPSQQVFLLSKALTHLCVSTVIVHASTVLARASTVLARASTGLTHASTGLTRPSTVLPRALTVFACASTILARASLGASLVLQRSLLAFLSLFMSFHLACERCTRQGVVDTLLWVCLPRTCIYPNQILIIHIPTRIHNAVSY